jgi:hypothetical protein
MSSGMATGWTDASGLLLCVGDWGMGEVTWACCDVVSSWVELIRVIGIEAVAYRDAEYGG